MERASQDSVASILGGRFECHRNCSYTKFPFLFIFFLVSSVLLVAFIRALNLTVTEGTLNGLLFYTMIIHSHGFFQENSSTFVGQLFHGLSYHLELKLAFTQTWMATSRFGFHML